MKEQNEQNQKISETRGGLYEVGVNSGVLMAILDETINGVDVYKTYMDLYGLPLFDFRKYAVEYFRVMEDDISEDEVVRFMETAQLQGYDMFRSYIIGLENYRNRDVFCDRTYEINRKIFEAQKQYEVIYAQLGLYEPFFNNSDDETIEIQKKIFEYMMKRPLGEVQLGAYKYNSGEFLNSDTLIFLKNRETGEYALFVSDESGYVNDTMVHIKNYSDLCRSLRSTVNEIYKHSYFRNVEIKAEGNYDGIEINTAIELSSDKDTEKANQAMSYIASFLEYLHDYTEIDVKDIRVTGIGVTNKGHACINIESPDRNELEKYRNIYKRKQDKKLTYEKKQKKRESLLQKEFNRRFTKTDETSEWVTVECTYDSEGEDGYVVTPEIREEHSQCVHEALCDNSSRMVYLVGAPGIGKTTSIQKFVQPLDNAVVIYISPRTTINREFCDSFCHLNKGIAFTTDSKCKPNQLIGFGDLDKANSILDETEFEMTANEETGYNQHGHFETLDVHNMEFEREKCECTVMNRIGKGMSFIMDYCYDHNDLKKVAVCISTQAIGALLSEHNTENRISLSKMLGLDYSNDGSDAMEKFANIFQNVFIIIDEISGDDTGIASFNVIKRQFNHLADRLSKKTVNPFNMKLVVMDASLSDQKSMQVYTEGKTKAYIGIQKGSREGLQIHRHKDGIYVNCNAYPARKVRPVIKFGKGNKSVNMVEEIVRDVCKFNARRKMIPTDNNNEERKEQCIVYLQNKQILENICELLKAQHIPCEILHSRVTAEEKSEIMKKMNSANACPVVLMTSSGSRGVSFKYVTTIFAVVPNFSKESNLMELIQLVFRGRGDRVVDTECEKTIVFYHDVSMEIEEPRKEDEERLQSLQNTDIYTMSILLDACFRSRVYGTDLTGYKVVPLGRQGKKDQQSDEFSLLIKDISTLQTLFKKPSAIRYMCEIASFDGIRYEIPDAKRHKEFFSRLTERNRGLSKNKIGESLTPYVFINNCIVFMEKDITQSIARYIEDKMKYFSEEAVENEMEGERDNVKDMVEYVLKFVKAQENKKSPFNMKSFEAGTHFFAYPVIQVPNIRTEEYEEENIVELLSLLMSTTSMISDVLPIGRVFADSPFITFRSEEFSDKMMSRYVNSELISSTDTNLLSILFAKNSLCDSKKHSDHKS